MTAPLTDAQRAWRRAQRVQLLDRRKSIPDTERRALGDGAIANLEHVVANCECSVLGLYWPIKREIDLLPWAAALSSKRAITLALPVVNTPHAPLAYCAWKPDDRMTRGFWNIPVPASQVPVDPDIVIAPLVGFLGQWRLGYGGGYFDRTLAARIPRPLAIGIGFEWSESADFVPALHDIPMNVVITERRISKSLPE